MWFKAADIEASVALFHSIAVVGAGMAGLAAARELSRHQLRVQIFDKGRRPGGRMSSRQREHGTFDLGAQYFTARDPSFAAFTAQFERQGAVGRWPTRMGRREAGKWHFRPPSHPRFTGMPSMVALPLAMAVTLEVKSGTRVEALERENGLWTLIDQNGARYAGFDQVVLALPGPQARTLIAPWLGDAMPCKKITAMTPTWSGWIRFATRLPSVSLSGEIGSEDAGLEASPTNASPGAEWQAITLDDSKVLRYAARNQTRPEPGEKIRPADKKEMDGERVSLLAGSDWSQAHLALSPEAATEHLIDAFAACYPKPLPHVEACGAHRWRYAQPAATQQTKKGYLLYPRPGLALCGDWCLDGRIEAAWLSGTRLASALIGDSMSPVTD